MPSYIHSGATYSSMRGRRAQMKGYDSLCSTPHVRACSWRCTTPAKPWGPWERLACQNYQGCVVVSTCYVGEMPDTIKLRLQGCLGAYACMQRYGVTDNYEDSDRRGPQNAYKNTSIVPRDVASVCPPCQICSGHPPQLTTPYKRLASPPSSCHRRASTSPALSAPSFG